MRARRPVLLVAAALLAALVTSTPASQAAAPQQLVVSADDGSDANGCTAAAPCLTIQRAFDVAGTTPTAISVGDGVYSEQLSVAAGQQLTLLGVNDGVAGPSLTSSSSPAITNHGTLAVAGFEFEAPAAIDQEAGSLSLTGVAMPNGELDVNGGTTTVTSSDLGTVSQGEAVDLTAGSLTLSRTSLGLPLVQSGGQLVVDRLLVDDTSHALQISGGSTLLRDSTFNLDTAPLAVTGTGTVTADQVSFADSGGISVAGPAASLTLVSTSIGGSDLPLTASDSAVLRLAATVIDAEDGRVSACSGPVVDGGWNSAFDDTCGFTATSSVNRAPAGQLHSLAYDGPDVSSLAPRSPAPPAGTLVDAIPSGSVAGFDPGVALCAPGSLDERGQERPVDGSCDIGAVELGPTTTTLTASTLSTVYGKPLTLTAHVRQLSGVPLKLNGSVLLTSPDQTPGQCHAVRTSPSGVATCTFRPIALRSTLTATYVPGDALHSSTGSVTVRVARAPVSVALRVPTTTRGHAVTIVGRLTSAVTHRRVAGVLAQFYVRRGAGAPWQPIGRRERSDRTGAVHKIIASARPVQYELRMAGVPREYLPGRSAIVVGTVTRSRGGQSG